MFLSKRKLEEDIARQTKYAKDARDRFIESLRTHKYDHAFTDYYVFLPKGKNKRQMSHPGSVAQMLYVAAHVYWNLSRDVAPNIKALEHELGLRLSLRLEVFDDKDPEEPFPEAYLFMSARPQ